MATMVVEITSPMSHRDVIEEREMVLIGSRDPRNGAYVDSPLQAQIELGLVELGARLMGGPMPKDQWETFRAEVRHILNDAEARLVDLAVVYCEATWPEGPKA